MQDQALPSPIQTPGEPPRRSLQEIVLRMQALLGERIEKARATLHSNEESLARLQAGETKIAALEVELENARKNARDVEIKLRKLEAENTALRARMQPLEKEKREAEAQAARLRASTKHLQETTALEIGRVVTALLPNIRISPLKRPSLAEKAALLVNGGIIDPTWYLQQNPDVAAAGMDAGVHYVLHGAEEGRPPKPAFEGKAEKM